MNENVEAGLNASQKYINPSDPVDYALKCLDSVLLNKTSSICQDLTDETKSYNTKQ